MTARIRSSATLAIHGGRPVRQEPMPPRLAIGEGERAKILEVLDYYREIGLDPGYQGRFEDLYCQAFAEFMGGGHADAVATGTVAIFVALAALGLEHGSEVLASPITDPGSIAPIIMNGLVPRLVDGRPDSFDAGVRQVVDRLTPKCKAVLVVHSAGRGAAEIAEIAAACRQRGVKVIEDCSQAHGAKVGGRLVGNFGDIAVFSTMYRKAHVTGASGGVVFTRDEGYYRMMLAHADRGKPRWTPDFDDRNPNTFLFPALNLHTDEISCGIGIASLARLGDSIARRLEYVRQVSEGLTRDSRVCTPHGWSDGDSPFYYPILVDPDRLSCSKVAFAEAIKAEGVNLNPHYQYLVSGWRWLRPYLADDFDTPNAARTIDRAFCLYLNENYGRREVEDTLEAILKVENHFLA